MRHPHFIDFWVTNFRNTAQWDKKRWHGLTTVVWKSSHGAQTNSDQLQSPDPQLFSIPMKWNMFKWPLATFHLIGISQIIWKHFNFQSNMFYAQLNSCVMHECRMKRTMSLNSNQWRLLQDNKSIYYRVKWKSVEPREQIKPALSQYNLKIQLSPTKYTYTYTHTPTTHTHTHTHRVLFSITVQAIVELLFSELNNGISTSKKLTAH